MLSASLALLLVSCPAVFGQYDDLSVLEEVLARTSMRPIIRQIPVQPTTTIIELLKETENSTEITVLTSSVPEEPSSTVSSTTQESTEAVTESTSQSTETPTTITELPVTTTFSQIEESTDSVDELFMGMKRPDLATIYRRLFPFRH